MFANLLQRRFRLFASPGTVVAEGEFVIIHGRFSGFQPTNWIAADILRIKDGVFLGLGRNPGRSHQGRIKEWTAHVRREVHEIASAALTAKVDSFAVAPTRSCPTESNVGLKTLYRPLHYTNGKKRKINLRTKALLRMFDDRRTTGPNGIGGTEE